MEARKIDYDSLKNQLLAANRDGTTYAAIAAKTGVNRTAISEFVNRGRVIKPEQAEILLEYLDGEPEAAEEPAVSIMPSAPMPRYKTETGIYQTNEHLDVMGWCAFIHDERCMGVMVGFPGSGKTTIIREFARVTPDARIIDCWPSMRLGDLLAEVAGAIGVTISGNNYSKTQQVVKGLKSRDDIMLIFDECENLRNSGGDVTKFETIRKIWDATGTPVIFVGTPELENILTRGGGRANLAQLYRRKYEIKLQGIKADEVQKILADYNVEPEAAVILARLATDVKHGGMGNFVEVFRMALRAADGGRVTAKDVDDAKKFKLLY